MTHDQDLGKWMFLRIGFYWSLGFSQASLPNFNLTYTLETRWRVISSHELNFNQFPETLFLNYHKCFDAFFF